MGRSRKPNYSNLAINTVLGAMGVISARLVGNVVGVQGQTASFVKIGAGIGVAAFTRNPMALSFGAGMAIDGGVDLLGPVVTPFISNALPAAVSGMPLMPTRQEAQLANAQNGVEYA